MLKLESKSTGNSQSSSSDESIIFLDFIRPNSDAAEAELKREPAQQTEDSNSLVQEQVQAMNKHEVCMLDSVLHKKLVIFPADVWMNISNQTLDWMSSLNELLTRGGKLEVKRSLGG